MIIMEPRVVVHWPKGQSTSCTAVSDNLEYPRSPHGIGISGMFTFRTSITFAVMAFVVALAALLIAIQVRSLALGDAEAASAYMDATSTKALGRLHGELNAMPSLVNVLATSSSVADSNERSETGRAIPLFKAALQELPQMDSIYAGFENGAWLQVRRIGDLNDEQRERLRATPQAPTSRSIWSALRRAANCRCGGSFRIGRATKSEKSIYGNTDTTRASGPGTGRR